MITVTATAAAGRWLERRTHDAPALLSYRADSPGRSSAEAFVAEVFRDHYGATVRSFMPTLLAVSDSQGRIAGVLGCRAASEDRLFIEQYLDASIEQVLQAQAGIAALRSQIVEVGNLASRQAGAARRLFCELTRYLHERGIEWVVFSGTREVRSIFRRLSLPLVRLGDADPARLGPSRSDWGSYYDRQPAVLAVSVAYSHAALWPERAASSGAVDALFQSPMLAPCAS